LFSDEGDMARRVLVEATEGVITVGIGVCDCASGDAACKGKRKESKRRFAGGLVGDGVDGALPVGPEPGRLKDELRDEAPLAPTSVNMNRFSPPVSRPRLLSSFRSERLP
jgi:hypothetical protein